MPGFTFPPVGRLGLTSPPSPVLCSAKTACLPVLEHFACRSYPNTLCALLGSWCPRRAHVLVQATMTRQGLWSPGPPFRECTRKQVALPSSRVPPMNACPVLRPRWCPGHLPCRALDCGLPVLGNRRLSPQIEGYPPVHHSTHFGAPSRGLHPRSLQLRTPIAGFARGVHS